MRIMVFSSVCGPSRASSHPPDVKKKIQSCFQEESQGTQYVFMDYHHLQIGLWNHLALRRIHNVTCVCACVRASAFLAASSGCLRFKTNLRSFSKMSLLQYVCYLCIKHAATSWGASQIFSMKIKVWITQRNVFFSSTLPLLSFFHVAPFIF